MSADALHALEQHDWPGNIRELRNVIERAVLLCDGPRIERMHLPGKLATGEREPLAAGDGANRNAPVQDARAHLLHELERVERDRLIDALARCGGNQTQAAELLGISRRTLVTRLDTYDLPRPRKRS